MLKEVFTLLTERQILVLKAIVEESQITLNAGLLGGGLVTRRKNSVARTKN